jgi:phospholipid/cholesterol/gamma-HCH transport system permease protein
LTVRVSVPPGIPDAGANGANGAAPGSRASQDSDGFFATVGDVAAFTLEGVKEIPHLRPLLSEVLRQAGIIATGSVLVLMCICFLTGGTCGLEMNTISRTFGVDPLSAGFVELCTFREITPFVFGYILAAKVGCGIVAEIGAMRVHEEIDAMQVMGIRPMRFLIATRMLGAAIALPIAYVLCLGAAGLASWLQIVQRFGDISGGTYNFIFFNWFRPGEFAVIALKAGLMSAFAISTALYFGYQVRGGPVEVGIATARSMAVNLIGITLINTSLSLIFWGANPGQAFG